jgi:DUF917 family protein
VLKQQSQAIDKVSDVARKCAANDVGGAVLCGGGGGAAYIGRDVIGHDDSSDVEEVVVVGYAAEREDPNIQVDGIYGEQLARAGTKPAPISTPTLSA